MVQSHIHAHIRTRIQKKNANFIIALILRQNSLMISRAHGTTNAIGLHFEANIMFILSS